MIFVGTTKVLIMKTGKNLNYRRVVLYFLYLVVIVFVLLAVFAKFSVFGVKILVVKSGSMEPKIKTGSLVIDKIENNYRIGEVITYKKIENPSENITHRIVDIEYQNFIQLFTTQGDANSSPDSEKVTQDRIIGKVVFQIPYFGYVVSFAKTLPGLLILIVIPAIIIIYDEIINIRKEWLLKKVKN